MRIPDWWQTALLALAAWRTYRLIAKDVILDPLRSRLVGLHGWEEGKPIPKAYREKLAEFLVCPACCGFWVSLGWWAAWQQWPHGTLVAAAPFAISALVILIAIPDKED
jgi:hypothetical protein